MMKRVRPTFFLLLLFLFLGGGRVSASLPQIRHLTIEDGLSSNTVHCIFQDSRGLMWFGTHDGLSTYDTYHFRTWRHHPDQPASLGNNTVYSIFEDQDGTIWIGTEQGLWWMDQEKGTFYQLPEETGTRNAIIYSITQDRMERIWISTLDAGIICYDKKVGKAWNWRKGSANSELKSDYAPEIHLDARGNLWCITAGNCLYQFDYSTNKFRSILIRDDEKGTEIRDAYTMTIDQDDRIWIAGWDSGIYRYDPQTGQFTSYLTGPDGPRIQGRIHSVIEYRPGILLLGSDAGLSIFDIASNSLRTVSYDRSRPSSITDNFVHDIYKDREGGIWIATYFGGINYFGPNSSVFHFMSCTETVPAGRVISRMYEDIDRSILIGTDDGGLFRFLPDRKEVRKLLKDPELSHLNIHALLADNEHIWVGTYSNGLYMLDRKTGRIRHFLQFDRTDRKPERESVYSIIKDREGAIWIGTKSAIYRMAGGTFQLVKDLGSNSDVIEICQDPSGNLWFASITKGLFRYDWSLQQIFECDLRAFDNQVRINEISSMAVIDDQIWIGTAGRGIITYDLQNGKSQSLWPAGDAKAKMTISQIVDAGESVWASTNQGLMKYGKRDGSTDFYNRTDGLYTDMFNQNSGLSASDGTVYFGANGGFNYFQPGQITLNQNAPHVQFNGLTLYRNKDKRHRPDHEQKDHFGPRDQYVIQHGYTFSIHYAALSYISPQRNRYRYRLDGYEEEWTEVSNDRSSISYTGLPVGEYDFRISACNNDGIWGPESHLGIKIPPYWWETPAAIALYVLLLSAAGIGIGWIVHNNRMQRKLRMAERKKHELEQVRSETELDFFTNLAHEIRTPVMLISSPVNEMMTREDLPEDIQDNVILVKRNSDKLMNLTDDLLNFRRMNNDGLTRTEFKAAEFVMELVDEFRPLAQNLGIELKTDNRLEEEVIIQSNRNALNKIISNLLTNALKFTRSRIVVKLCKQEGFLCISIYDNGSGIPEAQQADIFKAFKHYDKPGRNPIQGFGLGLSICNMLAKKLGIGIELESKEDEYSQFTLRMRPAETTVPEFEARECNAVSQKPAARKTRDKNSQPAVLIVDDDQDLREYIARNLENDFETHQAEDGVKACQMLKEGLRCDIIICDVVMPEMDGIELCRQLKNDLDFCHIPIVLLSANTSKDLISLGVENGADLYLIKPVDIQLMILQLNNLLAKNKKLWDTFSKRPALAMPAISTDNSDSQFLQSVSDIILENLSNYDFTVNDLAEKLNLSRSVLFLRIKEIAGMTPNNFIKTFRLRKAAEMLSSGQYKINEICYMTGFNTPSYFSKCFADTFGMLPKDFVNSIRQ